MSGECPAPTRNEHGLDDNTVCIMKKQTAPIGLAGCVIAACVHTNLYAQSSVTLQGMIDGGVTYVNNQHGGAVTLFDSGIYAQTR